MKKIDLSEKIDEFKDHINHNKRTILSAKFGDGKTYFLREFIQQNSEEFYFVTLHPINYSVGKNEDVFEYIKRDILCYLSKESYFKEVNWEKVKKKLLDYDTLLEECEFLSDAIPPAKALLVPFRLFKKVDDTYAIDKFFDHFKSIKGGIFEQDEFTIAIQETIACIKEHGKKCVLIIEDMDRLDPIHLFRILNVLGAHIDEERNSNKFGFDNIVLVLDYEATKSIFHYFYGEGANYEGYMDKFIDGIYFPYSIKEIAQIQLINKMRVLAGDDILRVLVEGSRMSMNSVTINDKIRNLSVRKVEQILQRIEDMILYSYIEIEGLKLTTKTPFTYMLALLTLIDDSYLKSSIIESVDNDSFVDYIGALAYVNELVRKDATIISNGSYYKLIPEYQDGVIIKTRKHVFGNIGIVPAKTVKQSEIVITALSYAIDMVRDGKGLKLRNK